MSRTLSAGLTSHLAGRSHTRCNMLLLTLRDNSEIGITDHNEDITFDIGGGNVTYDSSTGILSSDLAMSCGVDADNFEVTGPIGDVVTLAGVMGGRFDRAVVRLFQVNWRNPSDGAIKLLKGQVSEARVEGGKFVFEVRSDKDKYNQVIGTTVRNNCDADFGDGVRCFATATSITGTVTAVTDPLHFVVSFTGSYVDDYFNKGTVTWLTGANIGNMPVEIEDWTNAGGLTLFFPAATIPVIGDTCTVRQGCYNPSTGETKSRAACMHFGQILNFRGYPEVPGRKALMPAIPGN